MAPSVSFQISGPVVFSWIAGLAGFLNCCGRNQRARIRGGDLFSLGDRPFHPFGAGGEDEVGAEGSQHSPPLDAHGFRHGQGQLVAAGGSHVGQGDAGIAAGRLDDLHARLENAPLFGIPDHVGADAAFDRVGRVAGFDLGKDGRFCALGYPVESDQRGVADRLRIVCIDSAHCFVSFLPWVIVLSICHVDFCWKFFKSDGEIHYLLLFLPFEFASLEHISQSTLSSTAETAFSTSAITSLMPQVSSSAHSGQDACWFRPGTAPGQDHLQRTGQLRRP